MFAVLLRKMRKTVGVEGIGDDCIFEAIGQSHLRRHLGDVVVHPLRFLDGNALMLRQILIDILGWIGFHIGR